MPNYALTTKYTDNPMRNKACWRCGLLYFDLLRRKNGEIRKEAAEEARERVRKTGVFFDVPLCDSRNTI
jgi:hypothetical protein